MVNWSDRRLYDLLRFANLAAGIVLINLLAQFSFFRVDLTEEKRYSIKPQTRELLASLNEPVFIEVFLDGELNAAFTRFKNSIKETLTEYTVYSDGKVRFIFTDPTVASSEKARNEYISSLAARGVQPTRVVDTREGKRMEKIILPGALVTIGGVETGINFLKGNKAAPQEEEINQSIEGIEYELDAAIFKLMATDRKRVGIIRSTSADSLAHESLIAALAGFFNVERLSLKQSVESFDCLILSKPKEAFSQLELLHLDQYIMKGGKAIFLLDRLDAAMDSASAESYFAWPVETGLDELLFRYGVRINPTLIQDLNAALYPVVTGENNGRPQIEMMDWPFYPILNRYAEHPVTRNLDAIQSRFISSIDTVKAPGIRKTPLIFTSPQTRVLTAPVNVSVPALQKSRSSLVFDQGIMPVAYLLEGGFTSGFKNRFLPEGAEAGYIADGKSTALVVVADGDLARNSIDRKTNQPLPLGFDPYSQYQFANKDLMINLVFYLTDGTGLIQVRTRKIELRPLDKVKIQEERLFWQILNLGVPMLVLALAGVVITGIRRKRNTRF